MEVMEHNITQDDSLFTTRVPVALILDWDEGLPPQVLDVGSRGGFDMIVCVLLRLCGPRARLSILFFQHGGCHLQHLIVSRTRQHTLGLARALSQVYDIRRI